MRPPLVSIACISAATLAYEILLMRLFAVIQWQHFGYMIISLALLGYGVSGTVATVFRPVLVKHYLWFYPSSLILFGFSSILCFLAAQLVPFNGEELFWDSWQAVYLVTLFIGLSIPFFFAAGAISLTFMVFKDGVARIYAYDLFGAGCGSVTLVLLLYVVFPQTALVVVGSMGGIAFWIACMELGIHLRIATMLGMAAVAIVVGWAGVSTELNISPYKSLPQIMQRDGARVIEQRSSPLGLLSVVASDRIPLRHAPGLSLLAPVVPLRQLGLFTDGDQMTAITEYSQSSKSLAYLDYTTSALPYHLRKIDRLLILGSGGGADLLRANFHGVGHIDAIELNKQLVELMQYEYREYSGDIYRQKNLQVHIGDARGFLAENRDSFDLIELALIDTFNSSVSGLYALNESYLYTVEAMRLYLAHLHPGGLLAITRWIKLPPRDTLKLFATAVQALTQAGVREPGRRLAMIRSWQTGTLIVKNGPLTEEEIGALELFCRQRLFDLVYTPTLGDDQVNRFNILNEPIFYRATQALISGQSRQFYDAYKFDLRPATDDRPYFHHFFKWSFLPEIFRLRGQGGMPLLEWGYIVFMVTLLIAISLSTLLILLPLKAVRKKAVNVLSVCENVRVVAYFFFVGLAFLFIEIALMQKFMLFLHHPIDAVATVLTAFLVFAGCGSLLAGRYRASYNSRVLLVTAVVAIIGLLLVYLWLLPVVFVATAAVSMPLKMLMTIALIAPMAFFMGFPFPLALSSLAERAAHLVPWAWGVNGCASVISAVLAILAAIEFGFNAVLGMAAVSYAALILVYPEPMAPE